MQNKILKYILPAVLSMVITICSAQTQRWQYNRAEVFFGTGATNFLGELGGKNGFGTNNMRDFDFPSIRPITHFGFAYKIGFKTVWKNDITYGFLYGNDKYTKEAFRNNRNLHFRSPLFEMASVVEYYIFPEKEGAKYTLSGYRLRPVKKSILQMFSSGKINVYPYLYTGIAYYHFNPQAKYPDSGSVASMRNSWVKLKPLKTEGQGIIPTRNDYSLNQLAIPFGIGVKYYLNMYYAVSFEYGFRLTFTDYIDDASTTYVDPKILRDNIGGEQGKLAAYFSNPNNHNLGSSITYAGQQRGDIRDRDAYMFAKVTAYYKITEKDKIAIPKFK